MEDKHKDIILFNFGIFVGSISQDRKYTITEVLDIVKECCDENSK